MSEPVPVSQRVGLTAVFQAVHVVHFQRVFTIRNLHIVNTTGGAITVQLCVSPPGTAAQQATALMWDFSIPANDFIEFGEGIKVGSSWSIEAKAQADNSLVLWLSGEEQ